VLWVIFAVNFFATIAIRREQHLYVAIWFYIATIVAVAILHIGNSMVMPYSWLGSYSAYAGVKDALMGRRRSASRRTRATRCSSRPRRCSDGVGARTRGNVDVDGAVPARCDGTPDRPAPAGGSSRWRRGGREP
jgi:hypothetical protein